jgi:predicted metal-dependent phosphoesterase TrpH
MTELVPAIRGDFHLHTDASGDGGLSMDHIRAMLECRWLHVIGVTDHDVIAPQTFELAEEYPGQVFVGEEITTLHKGKKVEIIGLGLQETIKGYQSTLDAARQVAEQGAVLYIPHPFEPRRKGTSIELLDAVHAQVPVQAIERYNSRSWKAWPGQLAVQWALANGVATAVGSDAHGPKGWGRAYTLLKDYPVVETFADSLSTHPAGENRAGARGRLQPMSNVIGKKTGLQFLQTANWKK